MSEKTGPRDHTGHVERGRTQHDRERRTIDKREQSVDVEEVPLQSVHDQVRQVSHLQTNGSSSGLVLLSTVLLQEGHMLDVWCQDFGDEKLPTNFSLDFFFCILLQNETLRVSS